jgi:hypothetical protein
VLLLLHASGQIERKCGDRAMHTGRRGDGTLGDRLLADRNHRYTIEIELVR